MLKMHVCDFVEEYPTSRPEKNPIYRLKWFSFYVGVWLMKAVRPLFVMSSEARRVVKEPFHP